MGNLLIKITAAAGLVAAGYQAKSLWERFSILKLNELRLKEQIEYENTRINGYARADEVQRPVHES